MATKSNRSIELSTSKGCLLASKKSRGLMLQIGVYRQGVMEWNFVTLTATRARALRDYLNMVVK